MAAQQPGHVPASCKSMPTTNATTPARAPRDFAEEVDLLHLEGVLGHVGQRLVVVVNRPDLGHADAAERVLQLFLQAKLLACSWLRATRVTFLRISI